MKSIVMQLSVVLIVWINVALLVNADGKFYQALFGHLNTNS